MLFKGKMAANVYADISFEDMQNGLYDEAGNPTNYQIQTCWTNCLA